MLLTLQKSIAKYNRLIYNLGSFMKSLKTIWLTSAAFIFYCFDAIRLSIYYFKDLKDYQKFLPRYFLVLAAAFTGMNNSTAQGLQHKKPEFRFRQLNVNLSNSRVESIWQDHQGYIWIGTLGGLYRYDGIGVALYLSSDDSTTIDGNRAGCLFEDKKKRFWIGTEKGISYYNREQDNFVRIKIQEDFIDSSSTIPNRIGTIVEDASGSIWIGSERAGLLLLNEEKQIFESYFTDEKNNALKGAQVISLFPAANATLWVGTTVGLFRLNTSTGDIIHYSHDPDNPGS